jgi:hypothetical protein
VWAPAETTTRFDRLIDHKMLPPFPDWPMESIQVDHLRDGATFVVGAEKVLRGHGTVTSSRQGSVG